jgi:hypothetical protein
MNAAANASVLGVIGSRLICKISGARAATNARVLGGVVRK